MLGLYDGMGWGGWMTMTIVMVAFWSLVVLGVIVIFRRDREHGSDGLHRDRDPLKILDERLARGDIDVDEYQARRGALRNFADP